MFMTMKQEDIKRAEIFKVLSDPNRLSMIRTLYKSKREMTCGEVGKKLEVSKSTVSYHFKILRSVGLTNTRKEAQSKYLSLKFETFDKYLPGFLDSL
ncbi:metalloregulator ArsR/SmtB family transcription factor [Pediococcus acidilactici]|nr:metalloregulator ArsR/SmtB family transcription factor [Pediococcus acidilactici]ARW24441.1 putative HTH-type transcriptional regulator YceK [Pediococcus acidilactici]ARW26477.1 putative HTH-type transcriptional regulator YceK [Pediococcus acidilactici]ARW28559.1 putative HTH-type transcriptional regulator YceK [Pediococcus acidilactici]OBR30756.1 putative HTH-type transcriptional regulator YceK [Pediococcus acidilactici]